MPRSQVMHCQRDQLQREELRVVQEAWVVGRALGFLRSLEVLQLRQMDRLDWQRFLQQQLHHVEEIVWGAYLNL